MKGPMVIPAFILSGLSLLMAAFGLPKPEPRLLGVALVLLSIAVMLVTWSAWNSIK